MAKNLKDVANQYAKAIFDLSSDHQIVDETLADLHTSSECICWNRIKGCIMEC